MVSTLTQRLVCVICCSRSLWNVRCGLRCVPLLSFASLENPLSRKHTEVSGYVGKVNLTVRMGDVTVCASSGNNLRNIGWVLELGNGQTEPSEERIDGIEVNGFVTDTERERRKREERKGWRQQ